ncbi:MAG: FlgO family outer membrane protein [Gammaproteobacteria bacterium]
MAILLAALLGFGCATSNNAQGRGGKGRVPDSDLVSQSYSAADALVEQAPWLKDNRQPLLTATFVDINALENSSALGRIVAEQVSSRFAQKGFTMIEMKLRTNIFIKNNGGEFALSREVRSLSQVHNAVAVIAGTYAVGRNSVYVNARLIRAADNLILASYDYSLPIGPDTRALLASQ